MNHDNNDTFNLERVVNDTSISNKKAVSDVLSSKVTCLRDGINGVIAWTVLNGAALKGADVLMDYTAKLPDYLDGAVTMGEGILLLPALYYGNKKIIIPIVKKIMGKTHEPDYDKASAISKWAGTAALGLFTYLGTFPNVGPVLGVDDVPGMNMNDVARKHYKKSGVIVQKTGDVAQSVLELMKSFRNPIEEDEQTPACDKVSYNNENTTSDVIESNNTYPVREELRGQKVSSFTSEHVGFPKGTVGEQVIFDAQKNAIDRWNKKLANSGNNETIKKYFDNVVAKYDQSNSQRMTLEQYISNVDKELKPIKQNFNWTAYAQKKGLDKQELALVREIAQGVAGRELLAYSMTEIMSNEKMYGLVLETFGRKYVNLVAPSMANEIGAGEYQMTQATLESTVKNMNKYLPQNNQVPTNLWELQPEHHPQTAYLLAVENISNLVNDNENLNILAREWKYDKNSVIQALSAFHNNPRLAREASGKWLSNEGRREFASYCGQKLGQYAEKTASNYSALS